MTDAPYAPPAGIARRDLMIAGVGAAAFAAGLAGTGVALAQPGLAQRSLEISRLSSAGACC